MSKTTLFLSCFGILGKRGRSSKGYIKATVSNEESPKLTKRLKHKKDVGNKTKKNTRRKM